MHFLSQNFDMSEWKKARMEPAAVLIKLMSPHILLATHLVFVLMHMCECVHTLTLTHLQAFSELHFIITLLERLISNMIMIVRETIWNMFFLRG